jgi:hypothetical protein
MLTIDKVTLARVEKAKGFYKSVLTTALHHLPQVVGLLHDTGLTKFIVICIFLVIMLLFAHTFNKRRDKTFDIT